MLTMISQCLASVVVTINGGLLQDKFWCNDSWLGILPLHTVFKSDKRMIGDTRYMTEWGEVKALKITPVKHTSTTRTSCIPSAT